METLETDTVRLAPEHLNQIRASINWQALFAGLGLRKAVGKSKKLDWWAFSPFREEKTPSFHMGPGGVWYDFSIGEGGGAIELVQKIKKCNCYEAGRYILENGWAQTSLDCSSTRQHAAVTKARVNHAVDQTPSQPSQAVTLENAPIRQDLIPLTTYHEILESRGISQGTCELLGIGYLSQGRSPLKGRIVFQVADGRVTKKSQDQDTRVILSHVGRAVKEGQEPKYLFYEGFHKSLELYGQEVLWLHDDAADQISATGSILLTEGPFDVAKAFEAGMRNVVASFGSTLTVCQAEKMKTLAEHHGITNITIAYDRDEAGKMGAQKATALLQRHGLDAQIFDWDGPIARTNHGVKHIPETIQDLADFNTEQIVWLRNRKWL